jgi:hypothetical protein
LQEQQQRFDRFRRCFNSERPHEALGFAPPRWFTSRAHGSCLPESLRSRTMMPS